MEILTKIVDMDTYIDLNTCMATIDRMHYIRIRKEGFCEVDMITIP